MAVFDQPITTYEDQTADMRVISDVISLIDPYDTPLLDALGGLDGAREKFDIRENGYKVELLEDELDALADVAAQGTTITTNTVSLTVTDASIFQDGHVILVDSEYMVVSASDAANNTITVYSRSFGGTNATHASDSAISIVGMARLEGDDADYGMVTDISAPYNYTGIFQKGFKVTGSKDAISAYGKAGEYEYQATKALPHLFRLVELALFHGIRAVGSASAPRSMGGLLTFITNNSVNAGGAIAKSDVDNVAEYIMLDGGTPDLLVLNPAVANDLKALLDSSSFVRVDQAGGQFGMAPITMVSTQYGDMRLIMSRHCPVSKAFALDSRKIGLYSLRPFAWHELAKTGDSKKGEVVGEITLLVKHDKGHGWVYGITS